MAETVSLYVHVPFCRRRCPYCDFYSNACPGEPPDSYPRLIEAESRRWGAALSRAGRAVQTFFVGGGTPTVLGAGQLRRLLGSLRDSFPTPGDLEFTVECNPESLTQEKAQVMTCLGVNRLSVGAQALDDVTLSRLGRIHSAQQVNEAVAAARRAGFRNINLDLLCGCPGQSLADWTDALKCALDLSPTHLSCYCLTVEPKTTFGRLAQRGLLALPDEDAQAEMAEATHEVLSAAGFAHYEISNYALPGWECRHNLRYWQGADYLGLGPGATSCLGGVRWQAVARGQTTLVEGEALAPEHRLRERAMLALRTSRGVAGRDLVALMGPQETEAWLGRWSALLACSEEGYNIERVALSPEGMMLADEVMASLL